MKALIIGLGALAITFSVSANTLEVKNPCVEEDKIEVADVQEAGDFNWKKWKAVVPVDSGGGISTYLDWKVLRKASFEGDIKKFIKQNSNNTYELKGRFTGVTEQGPFAKNQGRYSATELIEVYGKKGSEKAYWPNSGTHQLKTRMKVYKVDGIGTTYIARIRSLDKNGEEFDKIRVMWRDGYILAEVHETYAGGTRYKRTKVAEVGENMFNMALQMTAGNVSLSIDCKNTGANKMNIPVASFNKTSNSSNIFRLGNYYKNDENSEDTVTAQIKWATLLHKG